MYLQWHLWKKKTGNLGLRDFLPLVHQLPLFNTWNQAFYVSGNQGETKNLNTKKTWWVGVTLTDIIKAKANQTRISEGDMEEQLEAVQNKQIFKIEDFE